MSFVILLDDPDKKIYFSGDEVQGRLILTISKEKAVGEVTITFLGCTRTRYSQQIDAATSQTIEHLGSASLFRNPKALYQGQSVLPAGIHEWPFDFVFPREATDCFVTGDDNFVRCPPFLQNGDSHPLPPNSWFWEPPYRAFVKYKLEASAKPFYEGPKFR